jgi:hypothetical protein
MKNRKKIRIRPEVLELEDRAVPAVSDPVGTFAMVEGRLALPNQATSPRLNFDKALFRFSARQTVAVKLIGTASDGGGLMMGPAVNNILTNPAPGRRPRIVPSVHQFPAGTNAQIVNFRPGSYTFPVSGGWTNRTGSYHLALQLVGDVNGDYTVNQTDIRLLQGMIRNPSSVSPEVYASADYDGSGSVNNRDLMLARQNMNTSAYVRPLSFATQVNAAVTPYANGNVRTSDVSLLVGGSPQASFVATNLSVPATPEVGGQLPSSGLTQTALPLQMGNNVLAVSLHDGFGQSLETSLTVNRLPVPVVIIPDLGGSVPRDQSQAGITAFYANRGVPASTLILSAEYAALIGSLTSSGYSLSGDIFTVPYDWRLSPAPTDATPDGTLSNLTSTVITQANSPYQAGYLGQVLASMTVNDPTISTVDIVSVGAGSLLARSYIQSPALGGSFTSGSGSTLNLPTVESLVMVSSGNEGIPQFYNPWTNDFNSAFGTSTASVMANLNSLFTAVAAGTQTIPGPDQTIDLNSITDPNTSQPSPLYFARQYFPSFRQTIADYDFLLVNGTLTNVNGVSDASPDLLLDLNGASTAGSNPWLTRVSTASATFGVTTSTIFELDQQIGQGGTVWPIGSASAIPTVDGQTWYQIATVNEGDGVVPLSSLFSTFPNDPRIGLQLWGASGATPPSGVTFTPTNGSSTHLGLLSNADFLNWLKLQLII